MIKIKRLPVDIFPESDMVVAKFFSNGDDRSKNLIRYLLNLEPSKAESLLNDGMQKFIQRHRNFSETLKRHYKSVATLVEEVCAESDKLSSPNETLQKLIGLYFTHEYSISAGALFNPSIVPAPAPSLSSLASIANLENSTDYSFAQDEPLHFVMSMRATGEGHISSILFCTGYYLASLNKVHINRPQLPIKTPSELRSFTYDKYSFNLRLKQMGVGEQFRKHFIDSIDSEHFSYNDLKNALNNFKKISAYHEDEREVFWFNKIKWLADSHLVISFKETKEISERVIFPIAEHERNGIEDARFVQFKDRGKTTYYGTYTAYDGRVIMPKLIKTNDFETFEIKPLLGKKNYQKNFALFPRKINNQFVMMSRLDGFNHNIMKSNNIHEWNDAITLEPKKQSWEMIQVGNCGSPIETPEGWLVITHGVGPMREYSLGAMLLDLDNPEIVISSLPEPLMAPLESEREGYVPNVLYTCGGISHYGKILLPYACSDTRISFATMDQQELINELLKYKY